MVTGTLTPSYTFMMPGSYQVALRVSAADGTQDVSVLHVQAANYVGPSATAGADQTVNQGGTLSFAGSFTDPDGSVSSSGIAWDFHYNGAPFNPTVTGMLTPGQQFLQSGTQQVALQVTDSHGLSSLSVLNATMMGPSTVSAGNTSILEATVSYPGGVSDPVSVAWDFNYNGTTFNTGQASGTSVMHTFPTADS